MEASNIELNSAAILEELRAAYDQQDTQDAYGYLTHMLSCSGPYDLNGQLFSASDVAGVVAMLVYLMDMELTDEQIRFVVEIGGEPEDEYTVEWQSSHRRLAPDPWARLCIDCGDMAETPATELNWDGEPVCRWHAGGEDEEVVW